MTRSTTTPVRLDWKHYWKLAGRRRWSILAPLFTLGLGGFLVAHLWPAKYESQALVLVQEQQVPEKYVTPNVVASAEDRLQSMTQQILSRTKLQQLIDHYGLYPKERSRETNDQLIDTMRKDIHIESVKASDRPGELTAFRISYTAPGAHVAQQVVNELTSMFIEQNLRAREQQSASTTDFLQNQLQQAKQELDTQEKRLQDYRSKHLGQLPEQEQSNIQILQALEAQYDGVSAALNRAEEEKGLLESQQAQYTMKAAEDAKQPAPGGHGVVPPYVQLRELRAKLADLQSRYTPQHPDVIRTRREIADLEAAQKRAGATAQREGTEPELVGRATEDPAYVQAQSRLNALRTQIATQQRAKEQLEQQIRAQEGRLDVTPMRAGELATVTSEVEVARQNYDSLQQKATQSSLATNLEQRQQGEAFRIVDPASLPQKPTEPNRPQIILAGWLLGLCAGIGLAVMQEGTDTHLRHEIDIRRCGTVPVLASVPVLTSPGEQVRSVLQFTFELGAAMVLFAASATSIVYTYLAG